MEDLNRISDERLFIRYAEGDGGTFRVLMERYAVRLLHYCRGFVSNEEEAEDLVQETFLRAIRSAGTYRATARFSTWIYTIARNLCLDRLKTQRIRRRLQEKEEVHIGQSTTGDFSGSDPPEGETIPREELERIMGILTSLEAETIRLTFFSYWSTGRIAELQNCSKATVRVRRFQALKKIRQALLKEDVTGLDFQEERERNE